MNRSIRNGKIVPIVFACLIAAFAACAFGKPYHTTSSHASISSQRAKKVVLRRFPGRITQKVTLENESGHWQYGVMVLSGKTLREVMVDSHTGEIANVEVTNAGKERIEERQDAVKAGNPRDRRGELKHATISPETAKRIVLKRIPGRITQKVTLENESGHWQYGVMVLSGKTLREVMVDSHTGWIANVEVTNTGKERIEARHDAVKRHKR